MQLPPPRESANTSSKCQAKVIVLRKETHLVAVCDSTNARAQVLAGDDIQPRARHSMRPKRRSPSQNPSLQGCEQSWT